MKYKDAKFYLITDKTKLQLKEHLNLIHLDFDGKIIIKSLMIEHFRNTVKGFEIYVISNCEINDEAFKEKVRIFFGAIQRAVCYFSEATIYFPYCGEAE